MLLYKPEADEALTAIETDPSKALAVTRLHEILDVLEADHRDPSVRRRRFADPPVWCVLVRAGPDEYVVLWDLNDDGDPVVIYVGMAPFV
jgi:hypothetical protein